MGEIPKPSYEKGKPMFKKLRNTLSRVVPVVAVLTFALAKVSQAATLAESCQFASYHCAFWWVINNFGWSSWSSYW